MIAFLNGRWLDQTEACVPATDRGFLFGDGVFETARLRNGRYFRLPDHLARLRRSAAILSLPDPDEHALAAIAAGIARRNGLSEGSLRITLTRATADGAAAARSASQAAAGGPDGLDNFGTVLVTLAAIPADAEARAERGWRIVTAQTRRPAVQSVPAELKGIGRPYALLARHEATHAGADGALLLTGDGFVTEGPTWNVFWRHGRRLRTPALEIGVLGGITRAVIADIAPSLGYTVEQGAWPLDDLSDADEIFATMSSVGIVPFLSLDGRALPAYWGVVDRECDGE
jgi:branched-chain amino acid aminotransferase